MSTPTHAPLAYFSSRHGELQVGGLPISQVAAIVGQTPFYVYDRAAISARVASLRQALPATLGLHYAIKANPHPAVVAHLAQQVDGLDVASGGELLCAINSGMPAAQISFAGPGKRLPELQQAVAAGVLLNVESATELERLAEISARTGRAARVALRVNPDFELKSSGMKMGGGPKAFGIDAEEIPTLLQRTQQLGLQFEGLHLYAGSQNLKADAIIEAQSKSLTLALRLLENAPTSPKSLNLGGGFGIPYFPGEQALDLAPIGEHLHKLCEQLAQHLPNTQPCLELGRYLVGEAGLYVCRVQDIKTSRGSQFLITDGGLHHHLAASGNFGQVIRKNYPVLLGNKTEQAHTDTYNVVGPLCTPLDVLGNDVKLPKAEVNDFFVVAQSGAYGASASPQGFLSHPTVAEILF